MNNRISINGRDDVRRDATTGALLACDRSKLIEAKRLKKENDRYIILEKRVQELEQIIQMLLKGNNQ
jgi:hypothetical protein